MLNKSVLWKATAIALVLALVLAALPTVSVFAANETNKQLETKWEQAIKSFDRQAMSHKTAHNLAANWLKSHKNVKASEKAKLERYVAECNAALASAQWLVNSHPGFDASGKVIDRAQAIKSISLLKTYVTMHAAAIRHVKEFTR